MPCFGKNGFRNYEITKLRRLLPRKKEDCISRTDTVSPRVSDVEQIVLEYKCTTFYRISWYSNGSSFFCYCPFRWSKPILRQLYRQGGAYITLLQQQQIDVCLSLKLAIHTDIIGLICPRVRVSRICM